MRPRVSGQEPDLDWPVGVGGAAVALEVDDQDLVALGQGGQDPPDHLARPQAAVQQGHRPPGPVGSK
jgi:hypothetical protein